MLISEDRKFIFLAVPKTGTTSIESHLQKLDPNIQRNAVLLPDGSWAAVHKHARAAEIYDLMGTNMKNFSVIAFVRDPTTTVISKYYYYKMGRGAERAKLAPFSRVGILNKLKTLSAKVLPIRLWALLYPYSMTHQFLLDHDKKLLVDMLGKFDDLQSEFERIFEKFGYNTEDLILPVTNKSGYSGDRYINDSLLKRIVALKASLDKRIFDDIGSKSRTYPGVKLDDQQ